MKIPHLRALIIKNRKIQATAIILFLGMILAFFWPVIFQGKVLAPLDIMDSLLRPWATQETIQVHNAFTYDAISQYLPYDWSVSQSLNQDGYVGWNPYVHGGTSIVENTMLCPGDLRHHLYRFLPFWDAWNLGIILQFLIAGTGIAVLLRSQGIPMVYALIGVVAFTFYSQFTVWIYHRWVLGAMCWSPWIIWSLLRCLEKRRIVDPLSIAFIALAFRGGHLQTCLFVFLLVAISAFTISIPLLLRKQPKEAIRTLIPFVVSGFFASLLAADVFIETIPALLEGSKEMTERPWIHVLMGIPTLITTVFPTLMGTPQSLDAMKPLHIDLFSIKFMGAIAFLLAVLAIFKRDAPLLPKVLFVTGLILPFTPADQWLYSRVTVIFALGAAWLAAWQLHQLSLAEKSPAMIKKAGIFLAGLVALWIAGSALVTVFHPAIQTKAQLVVSKNLPEGKESRAEWMASRTDRFLEETVVWHPRNLVTVGLIGFGLFCISRIHKGSPQNQKWALLAAVSTFGELILFATTWISFGNRPPDGSLYVTPEWVQSLKNEVGNGRVALFSRADFDYIQLNTPSAYGIRFAEGYDTVTPSRINPYPDREWNPALYAEAGISHLLVAPEVDPGQIPGWEMAIKSPEFHLYRNPAFQGLYLASTRTGETLAVSPTRFSPNRLHFKLPADTNRLTLLESHNPGWKFSLDHASPQPVSKAANQAMVIDLPDQKDPEPRDLELQYRPTYQYYYHIPIFLTAVLLLVFQIFRFAPKRMKTSRVAI